MADEWEVVPIGAVVTLQRGFDITRAIQRHGQVPVVSSSGVTSFHDTPMVEGPGVVLGRKGVVGSVHFVTEDFWPHDTTLWVRDFGGNNPRFVYYFFRNLSTQLAGMDVGSANPTLNRNHVHPIRVAWPPLRDQEAIATILGALDDKIELNRRMNETLEEMARALFDRLFVSVCSEEGRDLAGIMPLPEGWNVQPMGEMLRVVGGGTPSTKEPSYWDESGWPWATPKDLSGHALPVLLDTNRHISDAGLARIGSGLLPQGTVLLSSRAPIGYTAIAQVPLAVNQGFIAIPPDQALPSTYVLMWVRSHLDVIKSRAGGSTFAEISKKAFRPIPIVIPPKPDLEHFDEIAGKLFARITVGARESQALTEIRDALLPKLVSGKLRLPEAERLVSEVT